jgi:hypothetical protein
VAHFGDHPAHRRAGAVDENVDAACRPGDLGGRSSERAAVGDIDRMRRGVAATAGDLLRDRLGRLRGAIEDRNPRSRSCESAAGCGADPVPSAGDEGNLSGKLAGRLFHLLYRNSSSSAFASLRSGVSKPSVNQS